MAATLSPNDILSLELRNAGNEDVVALLRDLREHEAEIRRLRRRLEDAQQAVRDATADLGTQADRLADAFRDGVDGVTDYTTSQAETPTWWERPEYVLPLRGRRAEVVDMADGRWRVAGAGAYVAR